MIRRRLAAVALGLSLAVLLSWSPDRASAFAAAPTAANEAVEAQQRWHAVVGFWNNTDRVTIEYFFRWGDQPEKRVTLRPGERHWHAWSFARPNQPTWPAAHVRYDADGRTGYKEFRTVHVHASPALERGYWYGSRYAFHVAPDGYHIHLGRVYDDPAPRD